MRSDIHSAVQLASTCFCLCLLVTIVCCFLYRMSCDVILITFLRECRSGSFVLCARNTAALCLPYLLQSYEGRRVRHARIFMVINFDYMIS